MEPEPNMPAVTSAQIVAVVTALLAAAGSFGVAISDPQRDALVALAAATVPLAALVWKLLDSDARIRKARNERLAVESSGVEGIQHVFPAEDE